MPWIGAAVSILGAVQQADAAQKQGQASAEQDQTNAGIARSQALSEVAITTFNEARAYRPPRKLAGQAG